MGQVRGWININNRPAWTARSQMFPRDILLCFLSHILIYSYFSLPWIFVAFGQVFSSCGEWGLLFVAGHCLLQWLLLLWSLNSRVHKLSCSMACGILPHKGSNPSPALEGRFLTTRPPGKSLPYSYRGLRISLIPKEPWRKNDITRKKCCSCENFQNSKEQFALNSENSYKTDF